MHVRDLEGKTVKVLEADEEYLKVEVGGKVYYIVPDYDCEYWDCSGPNDPSAPYLRIVDDEDDE